jgi:hypothetical protein
MWVVHSQALDWNAHSCESENTIVINHYVLAGDEPIKPLQEVPPI